LNFYRKSCQKNYYFVTLGIFTILLISIPGFALASSNSSYDSGYDHGCDDARISDPSDRYINQPEKGPAYHTDEFMDGYYAGFDSCSGSSSVSNSEDEFESEPSSQSSQSFSSSSSESDWTLTVRVTDLPFGESIVWLGVKGPYGLDIWDSFQWREIQSSSNPDIAYVDFHILPNEIPSGKEFKVCGSTEPITAALALNCNWYTHTGTGNMEVTHSLS
jgi:hypothetical protein